MTFLPTKDIILKTKLSSTGVKKRLREVVKLDSKRGLDRLLDFSRKKYHGYIHGENFHIIRMTYFRNNINIRIHGSFQNNSEETVIQICMEYDAKAILIIYYAMTVIIVTFAIGIANCIKTLEFNFLQLLPLIIFLTYYIILQIHFKTKSDSLTRDLQKIFEAYEVLHKVK